jgi:hypothetical protein
VNFVQQGNEVLLIDASCDATKQAGAGILWYNRDRYIKEIQLAATVQVMPFILEAMTLLMANKIKNW